MPRRALLLTAAVTGLLVGGASTAGAATAPVLHWRLLHHRVTAPALTPMTYGAVGDGVHDDTAALQQALDAATATRPLVLPAGKVFTHTAVLHVRVAGEQVLGTGTLLATAEATSSVWVEAAGVTLDGPTLATARTSQRWSAWEQMGLRLDGTTGTVVRDVTVTGSAAAGIYVGGSDHFVLDHDTVAGTRADGIHVTGGSYDGTVTAPHTVGTGDDGVAVVSYQGDGAPCHDVTVTGARVDGTTFGRGLSVVGGTRVTETDFTVTGSDAAAVYVAAEGAPYDTYAPVDVTFARGTVTDANVDAGVDHGAVVVLSGETGVFPQHVSVSALTITGTRAGASRDAGVISYGAAPVDVVLSGFAITGGPVTAYEGNAPAASYRTLGWTQDGRPLPDHTG